MYLTCSLPTLILLFPSVLASPLVSRSEDVSLTPPGPSGGNGLNRNASDFHTLSPERNAEAVTRVAPASSYAWVSAATPTAYVSPLASGGWVRTPVAPTLHARSRPSPGPGAWQDVPAPATGWSTPSPAPGDSLSPRSNLASMPVDSRPSRSGSKSSASSISSKSYTDVQLLNLALDLQYLLQGFYAHLTRSCDTQAFANAGYPAWVRNRFRQIQVFADVHIDSLVDAVAKLGGQPVRHGCRYNFRDSSVVELIALAEILETVAVSTYQGMLPLLESKVCIKVLAEIMSTHARGAAWVNAVVRGDSAWNTAFEASLSVDLVINLINSYTVRGTCPKSNGSLLPISISAAVSVSAELTLPTSITAGSTVSVSISLLESSRSGDLDINKLWLAFIVGADIHYRPLLNPGYGRAGNCAGDVVVPMECNAKGYVYVLVVQAEEGVDVGSVDIDAQVVIGGPCLVEFPFDSEGQSADVGVDVSL